MTSIRNIVSASAIANDTYVLLDWLQDNGHMHLYNRVVRITGINPKVPNPRDNDVVDDINKAWNTSNAIGKEIIQNGLFTNSVLYTKTNKITLIGLNIPNINVDYKLLAGLDVRSCNMSQAKARHTNFSSSILDGTNFSGADLSEATLRYTACDLVKFTSANMARADMTQSVCNDAVFARADMSGVLFKQAHMICADFSYSNLTDADFRVANLRGSNFTGANLRGANLTRTNFANANLKGADLRGAIYIDTIFDDIDTDNDTKMP